MRNGEKQAPVTLIKTAESEGGIAEGKQPLSGVFIPKMLTLKENADQTKKLVQEHVEFCACAYLHATDRQVKTYFPCC